MNFVPPTADASQLAEVCCCVLHCLTVLLDERERDLGAKFLGLLDLWPDVPQIKKPEIRNQVPPRAERVPRTSVPRGTREKEASIVWMKKNRRMP